MRFTETKVKGAFLVDLERREDNRGFFARSWCAREFQANGLNATVAQVNVALTAVKATLRGMHLQALPHAESKTVRCTRGSVFDVVLDLRANSPSFKRWDAFELNEINHCMLYIPEGCAHGYQSLVDASEIEYLTSAFYSPESAYGVRFNDPAFGINWPLSVDLISDADRAWPDYKG